MWAAGGKLRMARADRPLSGSSEKRNKVASDLSFETSNQHIKQSGRSSGGNKSVSELKHEHMKEKEKRKKKKAPLVANRSLVNYSAASVLCAGQCATRRALVKQKQAEQANKWDAIVGAQQAASTIRQSSNRIHNITSRRRQISAAKSPGAALLPALAVGLIGVLLLLASAPLGQTKTHHSKRQIAQQQPQQQQQQQTAPAQTGGREQTNWWNLWWQQYINEAVQPTVRPIVAVSFNGQTIRLHQDQIEAANGLSTSQSDSANFVADIERNEKANLQQPGGPDPVQQQSQPRSNKLNPQQGNWSAVKPKMFQVRQAATGGDEIAAASSSGARSNRQANGDSQSQPMAKMSSIQQERMDDEVDDRMNQIQMSPGSRMQSANQAGPSTDFGIQMRSSSTSADRNNNKFKQVPWKQQQQQQQQQLAQSNRRAPVQEPPVTRQHVQPLGLEDMGGMFVEQQLQHQVSDYGDEADLEAAMLAGASQQNGTGSVGGTTEDSEQQGAVDSSSSSMMLPERPRPAPAPTSTTRQQERPHTGLTGTKQARTTTVAPSFTRGSTSAAPTPTVAVSRTSTSQSQAPNLTPTTAGASMGGRSGDETTQPASATSAAPTSGSPQPATTTTQASSSITTPSPPTTMRTVLTTESGVGETPISFQGDNDSVQQPKQQQQQGRQTTPSGERVELQNGRPATSGMMLVSGRPQLFGTSTTSAATTTTTSQSPSSSSSPATTATSQQFEPTTTTRRPASSTIITTTTTTTTSTTTAATTAAPESRSTPLSSTTSSAASIPSGTSGASLTKQQGTASEGVGVVSKDMQRQGASGDSVKIANDTSASPAAQPSTGSPSTSAPGETDSAESDSDDDNSDDDISTTLTNAAGEPIDSDTDSADDDDSDSDNDSSDGDQEPARTPSTTTATSSATTTTTRTSQTSGAPGRPTTTQQPLLATDIDIERLPKGGTGPSKTSDGSSSGGGSGSSTPSSPGDQSTSTTRAKPEEFGRLSSSSGTTTPSPSPSPAGGSSSPTTPQVLMMAVDTSRGVLDGQGAISVPMDAFMKMMMIQNQLNEAGQRQQGQQEQVATSTQRPVDGDQQQHQSSQMTSSGAQQTFAPTTSSPPQTMTSTQASAGRAGSTTSGQQQQTTVSQQQVQEMQTRMKNVMMVTTGAVGQEIASTTPAAPVSMQTLSKTTTNGQAMITMMPLTSTAISQTGSTRKKLQPPPTTRVPEGTDFGGQPQPVEGADQMAPVTTTTTTTTGGGNFMTMPTGAMGLDDEAGGREPKIELINMDLVPIQRMMAASMAASTQPARSRPTTEGMMMMRNQPSMSSGSAGQAGASDNRQQQTATGQVEPGMRLRPPLNQQQQTMTATATATTTSGKNAKIVAGQQMNGRQGVSGGPMQGQQQTQSTGIATAGGSSTTPSLMAGISISNQPNTVYMIMMQPEFNATMQQQQHQQSELQKMLQAQQQQQQQTKTMLSMIQGATSSGAEQNQPQRAGSQRQQMPATTIRTTTSMQSSGSGSTSTTPSRLTMDRLTTMDGTRGQQVSSMSISMTTPAMQQEAVTTSGQQLMKSTMVSTAGVMTGAMRPATTAASTTRAPSTVSLMMTSSLAPTTTTTPTSMTSTARPRFISQDQFRHSTRMFGASDQQPTTTSAFASARPMISSQNDRMQNGRLIDFGSAETATPTTTTTTKSPTSGSAFSSAGQDNSVPTMTTRSQIGTNTTSVTISMTERGRAGEGVVASQAVPTTTTTALVSDDLQPVPVQNGTQTGVRTDGGMLASLRQQQDIPGRGQSQSTAEAGGQASGPGTMTTFATGATNATTSGDQAQATPKSSPDTQRPSQQQQQQQQNFGKKSLSSKQSGSNSTFIPSKLRNNFNKQLQQQQNEINSSSTSQRRPAKLLNTDPTTATVSPMAEVQNMAIRQFGGANRMSALANQPVPFGRPAAMMMTPTQSKSARLLSLQRQQVQVPTFEYGPSIVVRRPDEPLANGQMPNCTLTGKNFCVLNKDYPMNEVRQAVERSFRSVRIMYEELQTVSDQELHKDDFVNATSSQAASGKFACQTQVEMMRPGWAKDEITREWMLVVNTDVFPQRVRTESCAQPNTPCEFIAPFYDSTCQQRYSLHRMISIDPHDPTKSPQVAVFKFPAGCVCRVHPIRKGSSTSSPTVSRRRR